MYSRIISGNPPYRGDSCSISVMYLIYEATISHFHTFIRDLSKNNFIIVKEKVEIHIPTSFDTTRSI